MALKFWSPSLKKFDSKLKVFKIAKEFHLIKKQRMTLGLGRRCVPNTILFVSSRNIWLNEQKMNMDTVGPIVNRKLSINNIKRELVNDVKIKI